MRVHSLNSLLLALLLVACGGHHQEPGVDNSVADAQAREEALEAERAAQEAVAAAEEEEWLKWKAEYEANYEAEQDKLAEELAAAQAEAADSAAAHQLEVEALERAQYVKNLMATVKVGDLFEDIEPPLKTLFFEEGQCTPNACTVSEWKAPGEWWFYYSVTFDDNGVITYIYDATAP